MNITDLIEMLLEEKRITPHAEVRVELCPMTSDHGIIPNDISIVECRNDGQTIFIVTEQ
jgi:hypothetical protein